MAHNTSLNKYLTELTANIKAHNNLIYCFPFECSKMSITGLPNFPLKKVKLLLFYKQRI